MIVIRNPEDARRVSNQSIHALLTLRLQQLGSFHDGLLVVIEASDVVGDIERLCGVAILHDPFVDVPFGHPDYTPSFDFVIDHGTAYEMHFDSSDGIGTTILIPKGDRLDADLLALCAQYAVPD
jgi:hypothetical protein